MNLFQKILLFLVVLCGNFVFSQTLSSSLDKQKIELGEVAVFEIKITNLQGEKIGIAPKNELLPFHFEEYTDDIETTPEEYRRHIEFSIFEEGTFTIPELEIKVGEVVYKTIPYEIEVVNSAQAGDEISDIMRNKVVKLGIGDYWELYKWYFWAFLGVLAMIFIILKILKYGRNRALTPEATTNQTLKQLDQLRKKKFIENEDFRPFYVELIDITRRFLTKQYHIPAEVLLTDDLIEVMKKNQTIAPENELVIEEVFLRGDNVKFAKIFPDKHAMQQDFDNIKKIVKNSVKDIEFENLRKEV